jgi:hypothetical protein
MKAGQLMKMLLEAKGDIPIKPSSPKIKARRIRLAQLQAFMQSIKLIIWDQSF